MINKMKISIFYNLLPLFCHKIPQISMLGKLGLAISKKKPTNKAKKYFYLSDSLSLAKNMGQN